MTRALIIGGALALLLWAALLAGAIAVMRGC
jgi:hypothetical protein